MEIKNIDDDKLVVTYDCQTRGPSVRVNTRPGGSARAVHDIVNDYEKHLDKCKVCAGNEQTPEEADAFAMVRAIAAMAVHLGTVKKVRQA